MVSLSAISSLHNCVNSLYFSVTLLTPEFFSSRELLDDQAPVTGSLFAEKYRQKLWEVYRAGSQPSNLQDSYKIIDKLKERVEQLQACSDRLRKDKETLEVIKSLPVTWSAR